MGGWATGLSARHTRGVTPFSLRSRNGGRGVGWEGWEGGIVKKFSYTDNNGNGHQRHQQSNMTANNKKGTTKHNLKLTFYTND